MALADRFLPLFARLDPETAHHLALHALRLGLGGADRSQDDPILATHAFGLSFANPIGLAAGFDKDAEAVSPLMRLGFGFVEAGTVTLNPQPGNPRPRLFRLAQAQAAINRMGFPSAGLEAFCRRLDRLSPYPAPLGINLGLNKDATEADYAALAARLASRADYLAINVSSPNTPGLCELQEPARLSPLLRAVRAAAGATPVLVKLSPDLAQAKLAPIVEACIAEGAAGLIVANTTQTRPLGLSGRHAAEPGGLSGAPLFAPSTRMLARIWRLAEGRLGLIGCGGVASGEQALAKILAGASLVQLYTAFAYEGPRLVPRLKAELEQALRREGFASLREAVGRGAAHFAEAA